MKTIHLSLAMALAAAVAHAGPITWEQPTQELRVEAGQVSIPVLFRFRHEGTAPVTFGRITSSCGCTVSQLPRATWQPGETGELTAHFRVGEIEGHRSVTIRVTYESPEVEADTLSFGVEVNAWVVMTPRLLWWRRGEPAPAKQVTVAFADARMEIAADGTSGFAIVSRTDGDGRTILEVTPASTDHVTARQVQLRFVRPDGRVVERTLYLRVM